LDSQILNELLVYFKNQRWEEAMKRKRSISQNMPNAKNSQDPAVLRRGIVAVEYDFDEIIDEMLRKDDVSDDLRPDHPVCHVY